MLLQNYKIWRNADGVGMTEDAGEGNAVVVLAAARRHWTQSNICKYGKPKMAILVER